jgi:hypothetical protein
MHFLISSWRVLVRALAALTVGLLLWTNPCHTAVAAERPPRSVDAPATFGRTLQLPDLPGDFDTREEGWLQLAYPTELSHWADALTKEANQFRALARDRLGSAVLSRVQVRLARDPSQMATLAPIDAPYPKYAVGVAYSATGLVLLTEEPLHPASEHDLRGVLRHELAHVALHDALQGHHVPLWFNEGFAIHFARENGFARTRTLWTAAVSGNLLNLPELDDRFPNDIVGVPLAYAQAADVVRYLLRQEDEARFLGLVQRVGRGQGFERALHDSYGMDLYNLELNWRSDVEDRYSLWPVLLSGTVIWGGASVLIVVAWRRKKRQARATLAQWTREEALEDARLGLLKELARERARAEEIAAQAREKQESDALPTPLPGQRKDLTVPKVEHGGRWHTLH